MLTLYHDYPSAASLVAVLRLQRLVDEGLDVTIRGLDVLGLAATLPAMLEDLDDWRTHRDRAHALGWDLPRPRRHPATLLAHLVGELADAQDLAAAWRLAAYRAHWFDDVDLSAASVLVDLADGVGLARDAVEAVLTDERARREFRRRMGTHRGDGIGGVPVLDADGTFVSPQMDDDDLRLLASL